MKDDNENKTIVLKDWFKGIDDVFSPAVHTKFKLSMNYEVFFEAQVEWVESIINEWSLKINEKLGATLVEHSFARDHSGISQANYIFSASLIVGGGLTLDRSRMNNNMYKALSGQVKKLLAQHIINSLPLAKDSANILLKKGTPVTMILSHSQTKEVWPTELIDRFRNNSSAIVDVFAKFGAKPCNQKEPFVLINEGGRRLLLKFEFNNNVPISFFDQLMLKMRAAVESITNCNINPWLYQYKHSPYS